MAEREVPTGAPWCEEAIGGAVKQKLRSGSHSTRSRGPRDRVPIPARFMTAVAGAVNPIEDGFSVRRSLSLLTKKEKTAKPQPLAPVPGEKVTAENTKKTEVKKVTQKAEINESTPSGAESSTEKGSIFKRGEFVRRSLNLVMKRKTPKPQPLNPVADAVTAHTEVKKVTQRAEASESYTLPPIPSTIPSVLEVKSLIDSGDLLVALVNLLCLRGELEKEGIPHPESQSQDRDLKQLYTVLRLKMANIVRQSSAPLVCNKKLLEQVARIVQEEERRGGWAGGLGGWREAWRDSVKDGVRDALDAVHLDTPEHNVSWLVEHLRLLGKAIVENLERVKMELQYAYPPSFHVFDTYVMVWHEVVREHLTLLMPKLTETKDSYALLNFICNEYKSERIMGSECLQPEMREEQKSLRVHKELMDQIKNRYCQQLQVEVRGMLEGVVRVEHESFWDRKMLPKEQDVAGNPISPLVMDIAQILAAKENSAGTLSADLRLKGAHTCLEELQHFPKQLEKEFSHCNRQLISASSDVLDQGLWVKYHIIYINSFSLLREHMQSYRDSSQDQVTQLSRELEEAELRMGQALLQQLKADISPFTESLMTKRWLTEDDDFNKLRNRVENLYQFCTRMRLPQLQEFVKHLHLLVMREYLAPLMRPGYSCKNRKNFQAAEKLQDQWAQLSKLFHTMESTEVWLYPLGDHLSKIIGQKNESDITANVLEPLVMNFPDISEKHLLAVLRFRANMWTPERIRVQQRFSKLKASHGDETSMTPKRIFFTHIQ